MNQQEYDQMIRDAWAETLGIIKWPLGLLAASLLTIGLFALFRG